MFGKRNIFLVGPMGSGKSAVGKQLARLVKATYYDSDAEIERRTGVDIPFIFEKEGEAGFRKREHDILDELSRLDGVVLSTGGGAILLPENRELLRERGIVAYLETTIAQQVDRVQHGRGNRPLLHNVDPGVRLAQLMGERAPLYAEVADLTVRTDGRKVHQVAEHILRVIQAASTG